MALNAQDKQAVVREHRRAPADTGSPEVQIALLSARIDSLGAHFQEHDHDLHSRQGLLRMVNKRRRLLDYLRATAPQRYQDLVAKLGLRK
jgi:small subunit ribosomal protein S15